jgi:hypothetical protein
MYEEYINYLTAKITTLKTTRPNASFTQAMIMDAIARNNAALTEA